MFWHIQCSNNFYFFWKWAQKQSPTVLGFGRKPWFCYLKRTAFPKGEVKLSLNGAPQVNASWQTITNKINCNQQRLHLHLWITQILSPCVTQSKDTAGKPLILLLGSEHCNFWHSKEDLLQCKHSSQGPAWLSSALIEAPRLSEPPPCAAPLRHFGGGSLEKLTHKSLLCSGNRTPPALLLNQAGPASKATEPELQAPPMITGGHPEPGEIILSAPLQCCPNTKKIIKSNFSLLDLLMCNPTLLSHLYSISFLILTGAQKPQQLSKGTAPFKNIYIRLFKVNFKFTLNQWILGWWQECSGRTELDRFTLSILLKSCFVLLNHLSTALLFLPE